MKKRYKWLVPLMVGAVSTCTLVSNANAYVLFGGKYTNVPYKMDYYNDCVTYTYNSTLVDFYSAVQHGISSWNSTSNTKVLMYQTTTQSQSVMDFHNKDVGDPGILGQTTFWINSTQVAPTSSNWYWTNTNINQNANWSYFPTGCGFTDMNEEAKEVAAHEEGHALGLNHSSTTNVLMYGDVTPYDYYDVTGPTSDEVSGVQAIYGTLN